MIRRLKSISNYFSSNRYGVSCIVVAPTNHNHNHHVDQKIRFMSSSMIFNHHQNVMNVGIANEQQHQQRRRQRQQQQQVFLPTRTTTATTMMISFDPVNRTLSTNSGNTSSSGSSSSSGSDNNENDSHDDFAPKRKTTIQDENNNNNENDEMKKTLVLIEQHVNEHSILLYMKGSPDQPQCGFSARVCSILKDIKQPFASINVLNYPSIREGIKIYSQWPTIPQLYINGEFIGGCDIVESMYKNGELQQLMTTTTTTTTSTTDTNTTNK